MYLSEQQRRFFEMFGFLGLPGLLSEDIEWITDEFEDVFRRCTGPDEKVKPHTGDQRTCIVPFVGQSEKLCGLLDDSRIIGIISDLLGEDFGYLAGDGNFYSGDTQWHSDSWNSEVRWIKIAFYLDPLTIDTGALRVIPGSHKIGEPFADGLHEEMSDLSDSWGTEPPDVPAVSLDVNPGDLVLFDQRLKHASFNGSGHRRMFTMNFCERCHTPAQIESLTETIGGGGAVLDYADADRPDA